jgi:NDP-sugar pyrophosphorylase family protein
MNIHDYCSELPINIQGNDLTPWLSINNLESIVSDMLANLGDGYTSENGVAIHQSARVDVTASIKAPAIIGPDCYVGPHALLRGGVVLGAGVSIGPGCEIKRSVIGADSAAAHFNFIGDSIVGSGVNLEAGAVIANHYNERDDKKIFVVAGDERIDTGVDKFGAIIGDGTKIGANAVTSPGTILKKSSVVRRLELIEQS